MGNQAGCCEGDKLPVSSGNIHHNVDKNDLHPDSTYVKVPCEGPNCLYCKSVNTNQPDVGYYEDLLTPQTNSQNQIYKVKCTGPDCHYCQREQQLGKRQHYLEKFHNPPNKNLRMISCEDSDCDVCQNDFEVATTQKNKTSNCETYKIYPKGFRVDQLDNLVDNHTGKTTLKTVYTVMPKITVPQPNKETCNHCHQDLPNNQINQPPVVHYGRFYKDLKKSFGTVTRTTN